MQEHPIVKDMLAKMQKSLDHTLHEFSTLHTGKANPTMVESVMVEAYGSHMRLKECAAITSPDAHLIQVQPWDKSLVKAIEKALQVSNIGINPVVDGALIRLPFPPLSRERREQMVKQTKRLAEEGRVSLRNARRDAIEHLKKLQKDHQLTEDDLKRLEKEVQGHLDKMTAQIEQHLQHKEKELLTV